jgi:hypothetical protein
MGLPVKKPTRIRMAKRVNREILPVDTRMIIMIYVEYSSVENKNESGFDKDRKVMHTTTASTVV